MSGVFQPSSVALNLSGGSASMPTLASGGVLRVSAAPGSDLVFKDGSNVVLGSMVFYGGGVAAYFNSGSQTIEYGNATEVVFPPAGAVTVSTTGTLSITPGVMHYPTETKEL